MAPPKTEECKKCGHRMDAHASHCPDHPAGRQETAEVELSGFTLPSGVRFVINGSSSLMVGSHFASGLSVGGEVERLTYIGGGCIRVTMKDQARRLFVFDTGLVAEERAL